MSVAAAGTVVGVVCLDMQISRDKACGHPKRAHRLDHEHGEIATAPASDLEGEERVLNPLLMPGHMGKGLLDGPGQIHKERTRVDRSTLAQQRAEPLIELVIR